MLTGPESFCRTDRQPVPFSGAKVVGLRLSPGFQMSSPQDSSDLTAWFRVVGLALAAFIFNTTEFVPVALLSDIAGDFAMPTAQTGLMITIYAWVVALASLPAMLATRKMERKGLLGGTFVLFIASHLLSSVAWNFPVLVASRLGIALAHSVFWSITVPLAVRVAPQGRQAQALGLLSTGSVLAMVAGVPLGRVLGLHLGWRITFLSIALVAILVLLCLASLLPRLPSQRTGSLKSLPTLLRRPALMQLYLFTILIVTAHFVAYSYIEPFLRDILRMDNPFTTTFLLLFGGAGILGSVLFGRFGNRLPALPVTLATLVLTACCLLLTLAGRGEVPLALTGIIWGCAIMVIGLGMQAIVLELAPDATDMAMSIYSGIYNVGIGGGALLGNLVSQHIGMGTIGYAAGAFGIGALLWSLYIFRHKLCLRARLNRHTQAICRALA